MRLVGALPKWSMQKMTGALLTLVLVVAAGALDVRADGDSPPQFASVMKPSWDPEPPRAPGAIVPDSRFEGAESWTCLGLSELVERHGNDESERLVRTSVVLEASRSLRARLLVLRAAAHAAGERLLEVVAVEVGRRIAEAGRSGRPSWLPVMVDPLALALEDAEQAAWNRWEALVPPAELCLAGADLVTDRTLGLALLILERDSAFVVARIDLRVLLREGRSLASTAGEQAREPLEGRLAEVDAALQALDVAERQWREPRTMLAELVESVAAERGLAAAMWASSLHATFQALAVLDSPVAAEAAPLVARVARRAGEYAGTMYPGLLFVHPTLLDLEYVSEDSPRRIPVGRLIVLLEDQLPLLERLSELRIEREALCSLLAADASRPEIDALRRRTEVLWYQMAHAARALGEGGIGERRRSWLWTRVGVLRNELLPLEQILANLEEDLVVWGGEPNARAFVAVVERQHRLVAAIETVRSSEAAPLAELLRHAGGMLSPAAAASADLARKIAATRSRVADADTRAFLSVVEGVLIQRAQTFDEASEFLDELRSARPLGESTTVTPPPSFTQAAAALRVVPDIERLSAVRSAVEKELASLAASAPGQARKVAILRLAALADVPTEIIAEEGLLTLRLRSKTGEFALTLPFDPQLLARSRSGHDPNLIGSRSRLGRAAYRNGFQLSAVGEQASRRTAPAVLRWSDFTKAWTIPPRAVPASNGGGADRQWWTEGSRSPPEWENQIQQARADPARNVGGHIANTVSNNWIGYGATGLVLGVGMIASAPAVLMVGAGMLVVNVGKDIVTASAEAYNTAYGSVDPRDRADMSRRIGVVRTWVDAMGVVTGFGGASVPIKAVDPISSTIGIGVSVGSGGPNSPADPYLVRVAQADALIAASLAAAKACKWTEANQLINQAYQADPFKQSKKWVRIGNRVAQLTHEWEVFGHSARASLQSARERAEEEVYSCGPQAEALPADLALAYRDEARWACDQKFLPLMNQLSAVGAEIARMRGVLNAAEAACDPGEAGRLAQEVIALARNVGDRPVCVSPMRSAAEDVLLWASSGREDPIQVLAEARREIERCRLGEARRLIGSLTSQTRCVEAGLAAALDETRAELLDLIAERELADARLDSLEHEADQAIADCDGIRSEELLAELNELRPCAEGSGSRMDAIADRLRRAFELISGGDATLIEQVKDEFNEATQATDGGCDMPRARRHLARAREILFEIMSSQCSDHLDDVLNELVRHGEYVEVRISEREALLASIRAAFEAGDAALSSALRSCSAADLDRATQLLGEAIHSIDSIPYMNDPACQELVRLAGAASELQQEAETLRSYWSDIDADLESARQAAAEGRATGVDVYCAGVRQKAQPSRCFASALQECEALGGTQPTTGTGFSTPAPVAQTGVGSGSSSGASSGGGSGRVQLADPEPCAKDMSWVPARQRFECTCTGYRFDEGLGKCVPGTPSGNAGTTQAVCDASWPGTSLVFDAARGRYKCECPVGAAWSTAKNACLSLGAGAGAGAGRRVAEGCAHMPGTLPDPATGDCRCPVGIWNTDQRRCVDTAAEERQRRVADRQKGADCERLYSEIRVFRANPDPLFRQMAATSEEQARSMGCDSARIADAIRASSRRDRTGSAGGGQSGTGSPGGGAGGNQGRQSGGGGGAAPRGSGTADPQGGDGSDLFGRCVIQHVNWAEGFGGPIGYLVYISSASRRSGNAPDVYGVMTIFSYLEDDGEVQCRGARDCLKFVAYGLPYQILGDEYSSFLAAEKVVKQRCPNPVTSAHY